MEIMENIRPVIYLGMFVVAGYFVTHTNAELINRTNCPLTEDEWNERAIEVCKSQPEDYQCVYNRSCKLEEFCDEKQNNYFEFYLREKPTFFKEEQKNMSTKSMDYWKIQDILYCRNRTWIPITEKPMISSTTGQPSTTFDTTGQPSTTFDTTGQPSTTFDTTGQPSTTFDTTGQPSTTCGNLEEVYLILFIFFLCAFLGLLIYINRKIIVDLARGVCPMCITKNANNENLTKTGKKIKKPIQETGDKPVAGGTGRTGNNGTSSGRKRLRSNGSNNSDHKENLLK